MDCMRFVQVKSDMNQMRTTVTEARLARLEVTEVILTMVSRVTHCPCRGLSFIFNQRSLTIITEWLL